MDLRHLNASQRAAVECTEGPMLVLAGAGSGKTRVITHRAVHLLELGVPPDRIVAVSFTNKAAGEMRERLGHMVGPKIASELVLATFHSLGASMLRTDPSGFELPSGRFSILDQGDVFGLVRSLLREYGHHSAAERRFDVPAIVQRISLWKNAFVAFNDDAAQAQIVDEYDAVAASIYPAFEDRLRSLGACDFDDLVCLVARRLTIDTALRERWQARFDYLMVDEYQDTNDAQLQFLRQLARPPFNLCVVGDDDQAIYGWRGAKVENILRFPKMFRGAEVVRLQENYRSRAPILECANELVRHNATRHEKRLVATRKGGSKVNEVIATDGAQEAVWIGKRIRKLVVEEGHPTSSVAVLYRSAIQAKLIEEELRAHGLPFRVLGGQSMYDKKEVKDALAYLKTILTPRDELSVRRALETPPRGIGHKTMERLSSHARDHGITLLEAVHRAGAIEGVPAKSTVALERFSTLIRGAQARVREATGASGALRSVLDAIDFGDHVRHEAGENAAQHRLAAVDWLVESVGRFEARAKDGGRKPRWHEYLGSVSLASTDENTPELDDGSGPITLATLHSAKGLEWDHVFIIGLEEGTMPHRRVDTPRASDAIAGDLEEERRLFYVGITRAREQLWLCRGAARIDRGREIPRAPSRFLAELPASHVAVYDVSKEEELSSQAIGDMADAFLTRIRPPE